MFTKEEIKQIEEDLGISEEKLENIFSFLKSHSNKEVREVFTAMFADPEFDEIERLFTAFIMGIDVAMNEQKNNSAAIIIHMGKINPDES